MFPLPHLDIASSCVFVSCGGVACVQRIVADCHDLPSPPVPIMFPVPRLDIACSCVFVSCGGVACVQSIVCRLAVAHCSWRIVCRLAVAHCSLC